MENLSTLKSTASLNTSNTHHHQDGISHFRTSISSSGSNQDPRITPSNSILLPYVTPSILSVDDNVLIEPSLKQKETPVKSNQEESSHSGSESAHTRASTLSSVVLQSKSVRSNQTPSFHTDLKSSISRAHSLNPSLRPVVSVHTLVPTITKSSNTMSIKGIPDTPKESNSSSQFWKVVVVVSGLFCIIEHALVDTLKISGLAPGFLAFTFLICISRHIEEIVKDFM